MVRINSQNSVQVTRSVTFNLRDEEQKADYEFTKSWINFSLQVRMWIRSIRKENQIINNNTTKTMDCFNPLFYQEYSLSQDISDNETRQLNYLKEKDESDALDTMI